MMTVMPMGVMRVKRKLGIEQLGRVEHLQATDPTKEQEQEHEDMMEKMLGRAKEFLDKQVAFVLLTCGEPEGELLEAYEKADLQAVILVKGSGELIAYMAVEWVRTLEPWIQEEVFRALAVELSYREALKQMKTEGEA